MFQTIKCLFCAANAAITALLIATAEQEASRRGGCRNKEYDTFAGVVTLILAGNIVLLLKGVIWG